MSDNIEKLARFEETINREADAEINSVLSEARAKAEEAISCADEEYLEESFHVVSGETKNIKKRLEQAVSQKSFEASREVLAYRNKLVEDFFCDIAKKVREYADTSEYKKFLENALEEINSQHRFSDAAKAYVREQDVEAVKSLYPNLNVEADRKIKLGGVTVFYPDEGIYVDKTLDNAFEQHKSDFVNNTFMQL